MERKLQASVDKHLQEGAQGLDKVFNSSIVLASAQKLWEMEYLELNNNRLYKNRLHSSGLKANL